MAEITQVIKSEDDAPLVWKHPTEDFNTLTQLIVHESQEAVFFMNGQALDLFGPGRHILETQNIPLVGGLLNKPTGDTAPFHCEVYFVNKTERLSIKWGTDSKVQYMEPQYNFPLQIGASGEMSLRVDDSRKLLVKIVGTGASFGLEHLTQIFRVFLQGRIKPYLARIMRDGKISIFETDEHMGELSEALHNRLIPDFSDYGLALERFFITTIAKPDGDRAYEKFKEIHLRQYADVAEAQIRQKVEVIDQETEAKKIVIEAGAIAEKRRREGFTYQQERGFDVAEKVAQNEGVGNFSNMGIGLGMVGGVAAGMGGAVAGITAGAVGAADQESFAHPGAQSPNIGEGGDMAAFKQKIEKLKLLREAGLLSNEEFEQERKKLLETL